MNRQGFILGEYLFALLIFAMIVTQFTALIKLTRTIKLPEYTQYDLFVLQFRQLIAFAADFKSVGEGVCFTYQEEEACISQDNQRLVKTPGYEILLETVSESHFNLSDSTLELEIVHNEIHQTIQIDLT